MNQLDTIGQNRMESAKNDPKTKFVAFLLSNVKNIYYFCSRKIDENLN